MQKKNKEATSEKCVQRGNFGTSNRSRGTERPTDHEMLTPLSICVHIEMHQPQKAAHHQCTKLCKGNMWRGTVRGKYRTVGKFPPQETREGGREIWLGIAGQAMLDTSATREKREQMECTVGK